MILLPGTYGKNRTASAGMSCLRVWQFTLMKSNTTMPRAKGTRNARAANIATCADRTRQMPGAPHYVLRTFTQRNSGDNGFPHSNNSGRVIRIPSQLTNLHAGQARLSPVPSHSRPSLTNGA